MQFVLNFSLLALYPLPKRTKSRKLLFIGTRPVDFFLKRVFQVIANLYNQERYLVQCDANRTLSYQHCDAGSPMCAGVTMAPSTLPPLPVTPPTTTAPLTQPPGGYLFGVLKLEDDFLKKRKNLMLIFFINSL